MEGFLALVTTALKELAVSGQGPRPARYVGAGAAAILGAVMFVAMGGCLVAALWRAVPPEWGPAASPLLAAAALALACGVAALVVMALLRRSPPPPPPRNALVEMLEHTDLPGLIRHHLAELLIGAIVAGLVSGSATRPAPEPRPRG